MPRLGELYPGICLTTEEKARKSLSQGSRTIRIHRPNNRNTLITVLTGIQPYIDKKYSLKNKEKLVWVDHILHRSYSLKARSWYSSVGIVTRLQTRISRHCGSNPGKGNCLFSFPKACRTDPESTQLPIQRVPEALPSAVQSAEVKNEWS